MTGRSAALALAVLALPLAAAPVPPAPARPAIDAGNADRVRPAWVLPLDPYRIAFGPGPGEVSFLSFGGTSVDVRNAATFKSVRRLGADPGRPERKLVGFAVAPDRETVAWSECGTGTQVEVRNLRTGRAGVVEAGNQQPMLDFSPDGTVLATGGYGTRVKLWEAATGRPGRELDGGPVGGLAPVFGPDGKVLAVGNRNGPTRLYEAASGRLLHVLAREWTHELRFSPDGRVLAVGYVDGTVGLWDVGTGRLLRAAATGAEEVYTLDWSPSGDVLATAGLKGAIALWNPTSLTPVAELEAPEWVIRVRFSPDGTRLLSAGGGREPGPERKVTVWSVADR